MSRISSTGTGLLWSVKWKHWQSISHELPISEIWYGCRQTLFDHLKENHAMRPKKANWKKQEMSLSHTVLGWGRKVSDFLVLTFGICVAARRSFRMPLNNCKLNSFKGSCLLTPARGPTPWPCLPPGSLVPFSWKTFCLECDACYTLMWMLCVADGFFPPHRLLMFVCCWFASESERDS